MLGGAAYSYPNDFLKSFPEATLDVVEIDPGLTRIARRYFRLRDNPRLRIFHEDGRIFLNRAKEKYDVIFGDAFHSVHSIPFHLTTVESAKAMYDHLTDGGVAFINIISAIEGKKGRFLRAEYRTFRSVFPQVYLFPVHDSVDGKRVFNIVLVAIKSEKIPARSSVNPEIQECLNHLWKKEIPQDMPVLRDAFAPTDRLMAPILPTKRRNKAVEQMRDNAEKVLQSLLSR